MAKDATKPAASAPASADVDSKPRVQANTKKPQEPSPLGAALVNIGIHSVLMVVVPLSLFYAAFNGLLDPFFASTTGVPRTENKPLIGGALAVVGVNCIVASFLYQAFKEDVAPSKKNN